ncbi:tetratricopeptide repeat protein [Photobacterium aphoticum]|uniref:Chemotaxis protein CheY n=2 Tax=Photobacterium aphoticum TaxID=754436 RepID=A0A0J1JFL1_9GAMM|nr:response regulator [Photobacterium aphoticum]KLV00552.1 chemotaxis protein CheY [Photobacterium aphoticum]PSU59910.1 response regulator [Photobacterium aphoticum]GHA41368.1 response regulator [Photobacterium aphoticum]
MNKMDLKELKVLIADDAPIVLASLRGMLIKLGFLDHNIFHTKSARSCIFMASRDKFDIIICDYNFGKGLNGKQVFEEFKHYKLINDDAVFVMITAESSSLIVRSILELMPDEYILKPININQLKQRLSVSLHRKKSLLPLYTAETNKEYQQGLKACDELSPFFPEYYFTIQKFKGTFLRRLKLYEEAKQVYEQTLEEKPVDWAKIGLANVFMHEGKRVEASEVLSELLATSPNNIGARVEAANLSIMNKNIPEAIAHLKAANKLVPEHSERELVISNLCISVGDYASALERYRVYMEINKETYRNSIFARFNLTRMVLFSARSSEGVMREKLLAEARMLLKGLFEEDKKEQYRPQLDLLVAHLSMEEKKFVEAIDILNPLYKSKPFKHFYDRYHFCWLLNVMSYDSEFAKSIRWCNESLVNNETEIIMTSKIEMAKALQQVNADKQKWLESMYRMIHNKKDSIQDMLNIYILIIRRCPTLRAVALKIVMILSRCLPRTMKIEDIAKLLEHCDKMIRQLMTEEERESMRYDLFYQKASERIEAREYGF